MGNASSQCNIKRRTLVLEEYLVAFGQDSDLFSSATKTLFGPSFPEKAVEHLTQLKTLRQAQGGGPKASQGPLAIHSARGQNQDNLEEAKQPAILQRRGQLNRKGFINSQSAGKD